jgi:molybdenum cofactor cytidylyltransferase
MGHSMTDSPTLIALIPAAGKSSRMGEPKLLLSLYGKSVLECVLESLQHPCISDIAMLLRADDLAVSAVLHQLPYSVRTYRTALPTQDMRASVAYLLKALGGQHRGGWLLIPPDTVAVEQAVLERMLTAAAAYPDQIIVPVHQGDRGHPTIFPPSLPQDLRIIPEQQGLNWLLRTQPERVVEVECPEESVLWNINTPASWQRLLQQARHPRD